MNKTKPLLTSDEALVHLKFIRNKRQEYFICLSLDSGQRLIARRVVTIGLLDMALAHPREVFSGPLKDRAASVIVAHNHPSGMAEPSKEDIKTTQQLIAAGILLGIPVRDHIIVTGDSHFGFRGNHML
jgi:DNA repair protein RadC